MKLDISIAEYVKITAIMSFLNQRFCKEAGLKGMNFEWDKESKYVQAFTTRPDEYAETAVLVSKYFSEIVLPWSIDYTKGHPLKVTTYLHLIESIVIEVVNSKYVDHPIDAGSINLSKYFNVAGLDKLRDMINCIKADLDVPNDKLKYDQIIKDLRKLYEEISTFVQYEQF